MPRKSNRHKKPTAKAAAASATSPSPIGSLLSPPSQEEQKADVNLATLRQALGSLEEANDHGHDDGDNPARELDSSDSGESSLEDESTDTKYTSDSRIAKEVYRRLTSEFGSLLSFYRSVKWNNQRNAHEVRRIIQVFEALRETIPKARLLEMVPGEMMMRNIAGLVKSDEWNKPSLMDAFELRPPLDVVPRDFLRVLVKDSTRNERIKPKTKKPATAQKGGAGR